MTVLRTRRSRITGLIGTALAAALLVTGCSAPAEDSKTASSPNSEGSALPAAEGTTTYPLTLESPYGTSVLEKRPERIAAIVPNAVDTEMLLALGVKPVLSSSMVKESASQSYLLPYDAEDLDTFEFAMGGTLPVEAIAASEPDLIVAVGWADGLGGLSMGDYYERLSSIAPVVTSPDTKSRMLVPWKESIRVLGETLDLSKAAEKIVADHDRYFANVRQENPQLAGLTATWAIFYGTGNGLQYLSAPGSAPATFLGELGFAENPRAKEFVTQSTVGEELLENIDADFLLIGRSAAGSEEDFDKLTDGKLFQALGAVSSGHWVALPPRTADGGDVLWAITSGGPIGTMWAAEHVVPLISEKL
ncbi:ABC transporter substrate-binding protein [Rhodococcus sp. KBW08]|uniref:ABC transporter substrate-binding protein n=1 Tax=Rhodococcus sp. KBW08 TaxID=2144188 RepID=UPI000F5A885A|nr:ABC transporter substrate-binding protein [Rhodococcus sp. KBW08]RQO46880.1 ABC transporter substrate-binding protein [Rhodococcus sp. KBW08]